MIDPPQPSLIEVLTHQVGECAAWDFPAHPVAALFPFHGPESRADLVESIARAGVRDPILVDDQDRVVDGRHRQEIARTLKVFLPVRRLSAGDDPVAAAWDGNVAHRHLTVGQRAMMVKRLMKHLGIKQGTRTDTSDNYRKYRFLMGGVSAFAVRQAGRVLDEAVPEIVDAVDTGAVSVSDAASVAWLPHEAQTDALAKVEAGDARTLKQAGGLAAGLPGGMTARQAGDELRESMGPVHRVPAGNTVEDPLAKVEAGESRTLPQAAAPAAEPEAVEPAAADPWDTPVGVECLAARKEEARTEAALRKAGERSEAGRRLSEVEEAAYERHQARLQPLVDAWTEAQEVYNAGVEASERQFETEVRAERDAYQRRLEATPEWAAAAEAVTRREAAEQAAVEAGLLAWTERSRYTPR